MPKESDKKTVDMPFPARILAAVVGLVLLALGFALGFGVRPLTWQIALGTVVSLGMGIDLLHAAYCGRWPVSFLLWLVP